MQPIAFQKAVVLVLFLLLPLAASFATPPPATVLFSGRMDYALGSNPQDIAVGDLNSDGNLDLVTVNNLSSSASVSVLLGNIVGGTFQPAVNYTVPAGAFMVQLGDFNGDGKLDILVAAQSSSVVSVVSVAVLLGNGDGTFQAAKITDIANSNCRCLAVGNFQGGGTLDIALPVSVPQLGDSALAVMQGNGDGTFQAPVVVNPGPFPTPSESGLFAAADFNNDGNPDLLWGVFNSGFYVFLGKGDGTFQPPIHTTITLAFGLAIADFTGDGKLDVACFDCGSVEGVAVLPGNGDGTFGPPISTGLVNNGGGGVAMYSADVNGDGKQDLVLLGFDGGGADAVLLGNGNGTFQSPGSGISLTALPGTLAAFGDFNKDGKLDIATATGSSSNLGIVSVAFGNGDGTFQFDAVVNTGGSGGLPVVALADDFTGHGNTDLLEILGFSNSQTVFVVLPGNGNGTFQIPTTSVPVQSCGSEGGFFPACSAVAGDFRSDGEFDLAITGFLTFPSVPTKVGVFLGNGDGTFQPEVDYSGGGNSIVLGDINNDKIPDVITCGDGTKNVYFMLGKGDGTFGFTTTVTINETANAVAVADFNGDGNLDLAVGTPSGIAILLGNGNGTFGPEIDTPIPGGVTALAVGDFNGDGLPDLVAGNSSSNIVSELFNAKGGSFLPPNTYPVIGRAIDLAVADFNGDGIPDVAVLNNADLSGSPLDVSILFGNSDGMAFLPALSFGVSNSTDTQFAIADLNGDGSPDIAVGNSLLFNGPNGIKDFSLGPVSGFPASQTISAGQSAKFKLAIGALGPYVINVNLSCQLSPVASVAPPTCTLSPSATQVDGSGIRLATVDVTVGTTAPVTTGALRHADFPRGMVPATWTLMLVALSWLLPRNRKRSARLAVPLIALALASSVGCGGGSSSHTAPGTPAGTYTATITATATINGNSSQTVSHKMNLTVVVQ